MEYLNFNNTTIEYELYKSKKAKRICITIKNSKVRVAVPMDINIDKAKSFVEEHKDWINKNFQKHIGNNHTPKYVTGEKLPYRGRNYPLKIVESNTSPNFAIFKGSQIWVYIPENLTNTKRSKIISKLLTIWYKGQAEKTLPEMTRYYSKLMNISFAKIRIKDQQTRWGSCSSKKNINLNWRLIMAPNQVAAYVIIHELAHINYMNHSRDFWFLVSNYFPDYMKWKKWLKGNGNQLLLIAMES